MILNKLIINNFRQYVGENSIDFCSGEKNVTLIYGENGYGKTGIFRAVMFALFGVRYLKQDNLTRDEQNEGLVLVNEKLLEGNPNKDIMASVVLIFEDKGKQYEIKRVVSARMIEHRIVQEPKEVSLIITENFNTRPAIKDLDVVDSIISSIINKNIKDFFLFDGEQIEELTKHTKESREEVKKGIRTLLNLDVIEIVIEAFRKQLRELDKKIEINSSGELEVVTEKLNQKNAEYEVLEERTSTLKKDIVNAQQREEEIEKQISENKIILEKQKDRNQLKNKIKEDLGLLEELRKKTKELLSVSGAYIGASEVSECYMDLNQRLDNKEFSISVRKEFIDKLLKQCRCICGNNLNEHPEAREFLLKFQEENCVSGNSDDAIKIYGAISSLKGKIPIMTSDVDKVLTNYNTCMEDIAQCEKMIELYNEELKTDIPDLGYALQKVKNDIIKMNKELGQNEAKLTRLNSEIKDLSDKQEELSENDVRSKRVVESKKLLSKANDELVEISKEYVNELRDKLSECATEIFRKIAGKSTLDSLSNIVILDDFQLEVLSKGGTKMLQEISAGQKVVVSLSYIGALLQVGSNLEMPLLMDTPFGRLSSTPRAECIRILPNLLNQWILLTTDTELQGEEATLLRRTNRWGKVYEIKHIGDRESRIVEKNISNWIPMKATQGRL